KPSHGWKKLLQTTVSCLRSENVNLCWNHCRVTRAGRIWNVALGSVISPRPPFRHLLMKRCRTCNRVETDKALKFCRVDGTPLVTAATSEPESATMALPASRPSEEITTGRLRVTPSIAVLPFANMSADPEYEYFCDGLAEELLNALVKI